MRRTFRGFFLSFTFLLGMQFPTAAFADNSKVYLESDCLAVLGAGRRAKVAENSTNANETVVEEDSGYLSYDRVTVVEKRDGEISESYVQIRNCRQLKSGKAVQ